MKKALKLQMELDGAAKLSEWFMQKGQGLDLRGRSLKSARLDRVDLRRALLEKTQLQGADLSEAQLQGARMDSTFIHGARIPDKHLLQSMNGLDESSKDKTNWPALEKLSSNQAYLERIQAAKKRASNKQFDHNKTQFSENAGALAQALPKVCQINGDGKKQALIGALKNASPQAATIVWQKIADVTECKGLIADAYAWAKEYYSSLHFMFEPPINWQAMINEAYQRNQKQLKVEKMRSANRPFTK